MAIGVMSRCSMHKSLKSERGSRTLSSIIGQLILVAKVITFPHDETSATGFAKKTGAAQIAKESRATCNGLEHVILLTRF